jgi:hypothetical protein
VQAAPRPQACKKIGKAPTCADAIRGDVEAAESAHTSAVWPIKNRWAPVSNSCRMSNEAAA